MHSYMCALTKNKTFEFNCYRLTSRLFEFSGILNERFKDHGGYIFTFGLFGFIIELSVTDNRHWDHLTNDWENDDGK